MCSNIEGENCTYCGTVVWISVNTFTTCAAVLGNMLTILAILFSKKLSSLISNYFVFSLAVSDLLVGCSIPYHMIFYILKDLGKVETNCLLRFVLTAFACASSICNIVFIATDRYIAIVHPFHYKRLMTKKIAMILIVIGWLASFAMASIPIAWNDWREGVTCEVINVLPFSYLNYILFPIFIIIWLMMCIMYSRICKEASGHAKRIKTSTNLHHLLSIKDSKSLQVMLLILGCFSICWLPYFVITLYARTTKDKYPSLYEIFFNLAVANSSMNPLIYSWKNRNFRKAFLSLIKCHKPNSVSSVNYVTNHVPSKNNSINGICNTICQHEETVKTELDIELQMCKMKSPQNYCNLTPKLDNGGLRTVHLN